MSPPGHIRVPAVSRVATAPVGLAGGGPCPAHWVLSQLPHTLSTLLGSESGHSQVVSLLIPDYCMY